MTECSVYLIGEVCARHEPSFVKVGISGEVAKRLRAIRTSCPFRVDAIMEWWTPSRAMAARIERDFHIDQSARRSSGEWFLMSTSDAIEVVERIIRQTGENFLWE